MDICRNTPLQSAIHVMLAMAVCLGTTSAAADAPALLGDLDSLNAEKLSKEKLDQLLPGAKMHRIAASTGSNHRWTNDADGTFLISTDNKAGIGRSITNRTGQTAQGTWHIAPDGRYCVTIEWKTVATEDWCRYVIKTSEGYYLTKSDKSRTEKVYRIWINEN
jgi:hypothetical protein